MCVFWRYRIWCHQVTSRVLWVVGGGWQFGQHPVLCHLLQGDKIRANNRPCLLDAFIQSVGLPPSTHPTMSVSSENFCRWGTWSLQCRWWRGRETAQFPGGGAPMLQSVRQTVIEPCDKRRMHLHVLQFGLQQPGLDGVEGAGGAEEHGAGVKSVENRLSTVHFPQLLLQRFSGSRLHLSPHSIRPWCRCSPVCVPVFSCSCPYSPWC